MRKPSKWDHIFDIVHSQDALKVPLKPHPKATMGDGAKLSQLEIPTTERGGAELVIRLSGQMHWGSEDTLIFFPPCLSF